MPIKNKKKVYYTHDNGNRAFKVIIEDKKVYVYKHIGWDEDTDESIYSEKSIKYLNHLLLAALQLLELLITGLFSKSKRKLSSLSLFSRSL